MKTYFTISEPSTGLFKDRGSKFLSFANPVATAEDIKEVLAGLRREYHDARHHCYAYLLGMEEQQWRANDDGEPNHSAGDPILGQIRSFGLTNTIVVVVRYFGGTKLGVGGLVNAYKTATEQALGQAQKVEIFPSVRLSVTYEYEQTPIFERLFSPYEMKIIDREFSANCKLVVEIKKVDYPSLRERNQLPNAIDIRLLNP